jgi:CheY-like chemotaxis protein
MAGRSSVHREYIDGSRHRQRIGSDAPIAIMIAVMTPAAILLSDDLIFTSRISGTGRDLGLNVIAARSQTALLDVAVRQPPTCVIVDLAFPALDVPALIAGLGQLPHRPRVVAYGSHVDTASLKAARAAGCDVVLPRSKFVEDLPTELPHWLAEEAGS